MGDAFRQIKIKGDECVKMNIFLRITPLPFSKKFIIPLLLVNFNPKLERNFSSCALNGEHGFFN